MNLSFESVSQLILCSVEETEERSTLNNAEKNHFYRWKVFGIKVKLIKFKITSLIYHMVGSTMIHLELSTSLKVSECIFNMELQWMYVVASILHENCNYILC